MGSRLGQLGLGKTYHQFGNGGRTEEKGVGEAARARLATAARNARHPPARTGKTQPSKSSKAGRRPLAAQVAARRAARA
jgi:hypothetical protein